MRTVWVREPCSKEHDYRGRVNVYLMEQSRADVPSDNDWLSANDVACLNGMRFEKRRTDWRLGRWTAKRALAAYLGSPMDARSLAMIEIRPEPSGAPVAFVAGKPANAEISLSHRDGTALCAIAQSGAALGCDIEVVEARSDAFVTDYFTAVEQEFISNTNPQSRSQLLALLWSAKESVLKTLRVGLRVDTRSLTVEPARDPVPLFHPSHTDEWHSFNVQFAADQVFQGWWQHAATRVRTVVAVPSPSRPILLTEHMLDF